MNLHAELKPYERNILLLIKTMKLSWMSWKETHFQGKP